MARLAVNRPERVQFLPCPPNIMAIEKINDLNLKVGEKVIRIDGFIYNDESIEVIIIKLIEDGNSGLEIWHRHTNSIKEKYITATIYKSVSKHFKRINETQSQKINRLKNIK